MTQTTDNSVKSTCTESTSSTTFTVIMDHDREGEKGTRTSAAKTALEEQQNLEEALEMETKVNDEKQQQFGSEPLEKVAPERIAESRAGISVGIVSSNVSDSHSATAVAKLDGTGNDKNASIPSEIMDVSVNSTDSSQFSKIPMCAVCSEPCVCYCKSCKRVCYCSKEHQKKHWKEHSPECYPVMVQVNSVFGSHLVVTKDVKRGEVILREKPLVFGPFLGYDVCGDRKERSVRRNGDTVPSSLQSACLTCHKIIWDHDGTKLSTSTCSKCGWPICSQDCEKNPTHADQECKIFAEYHVEPSALCDKDAQYLCVALLRILFHKKGNSPSTISNSSDHHDTTEVTAVESSHNGNNSKWTKFMEVVNKQMPMKDGLNSQLAEAKKATARFSDLITKSLGSIIHQEFSVRDAEIDQIVRTLRTSSFITDTDGYYINGFVGFSLSMNNNGSLGHYHKNSSASSAFAGRMRGTDADDVRNGTFRCFGGKGKCLSLYHLASMLTSNCIPNASWIIHESLDFYLRASTPIKTGERITITFVDPLLGTWERRERLWQEKYLLCSCSRCSDPTESSTFFSAIKCPTKKKEDGRNSDSGSECEGYILPTDPLAVTYRSWHSGRTTCFCEFDTATQEKEGTNDDSYNNLNCNENSIFPGSDDTVSITEDTLCETGMRDWKCNVCLTKQPWGFVRNSLQRMKENTLEGLKEISVKQDICFTTTTNFNGASKNTLPLANKLVEEEEDDAEEKDDGTRTKQRCGDYLKNLEIRVDKIDSFVRNVAHVNHYDVLKIENELLTEISNLLEMGHIPLEEMEKWAFKMVELCKKGLKVVNILCPGLSRERGYLLNFLQQGLVIGLLFKSSRAMRSINATFKDDETNGMCKETLSYEELMKKFQEILLARKEILEIFAMSRENSEEEKILKTVQHDSIEIRLLKNYFKCHQNITRDHSIVFKRHKI